MHQAAAENRLADAAGSLKAILDGSGYRASERLANAVIEAAADFGEEAVRGAADELVGYAVGHAEYWKDDDAITPAGAAFRRLSPYLSGDRASAVEHALDPGFAAPYRIRVVREFVVPVDPDVAVTVVAALLEEIVEGGVSEEERSSATGALGLLEMLADARPKNVAEIIGGLEIDPGDGELCDRLIRVAANAKTERPLNPAVIAAGGRESPEAARAALACLMRWHGVEGAHIRAALDAFASHPESVNPGEIARLIRAHRDVVAQVDQLGVLAAAGAFELAELVAPHLNFRRGVIPALFSAARRVADLDIAERRFRFVEAWRGRSRQTDQRVVDGFVVELEQLTTEARLKIVMESLLRYFEAGDDVPYRRRLREAVFGAMQRLEAISDEELQQLLKEARTRLSLETRSSRSRVEKLFRRLFS